MDQTSYDPLIDAAPAPAPKPKRPRVVNVSPPPGLVEDPAEALPVKAEEPEAPAAGPTLVDLRREQREQRAARPSPDRRRPAKRRLPGNRAPMFALTPQPPK